MNLIIIDNQRCEGCHLCVAACPTGGLKLVENTVVKVERGDCRNCHNCEYICASGAISWCYEIVLSI